MRLNIQIAFAMKQKKGNSMTKIKILKSRVRYNAQEGFCLPSWLTPYEGHARQFAALQRMQAKTSKSKAFEKRITAVAALRREVLAVLDSLYLTYPGSRAERDYKDLYLQIKQLEAKLLKNNQEV